MRVAVGLARQPGSDAGRELVRLENEIERLDRLIGQVLHLARLDATARAELLAEEVDLVELLDAIARDAAFEAQGRGVAIDWQPPAAAPHLRGNGAWLASAIENVVRNAVRYTAPGSAVALELVVDPTAVRIRIRDHGPGVPEAELRAHLRPFHRVAESRTRDSGGDGIGLAITAACSPRTADPRAPRMRRTAASSSRCRCRPVAPRRRRLIGAGRPSTLLLLARNRAVAGPATFMDTDARFWCGPRNTVGPQ